MTVTGPVPTGPVPAGEVPAEPPGQEGHGAAVPFDDRLGKMPCLELGERVG